MRNLQKNHLHLSAYTHSKPTVNGYFILLCCWMFRSSEQAHQVCFFGFFLQLSQIWPFQFLQIISLLYHYGCGNSNCRFKISVNDTKTRRAESNRDIYLEIPKSSEASNSSKTGRDEAQNKVRCYNAETVYNTNALHSHYQTFIKKTYSHFL